MISNLKVYLYDDYTVLCIYSDTADTESEIEMPAVEEFRFDAADIKNSASKSKSLLYKN